MRGCFKGIKKQDTMCGHYIFKWLIFLFVFCVCLLFFARPLKFIEDYISDHVYPVYANTHTTTGVMARQTTQFRKEAR